MGSYRADPHAEYHRQAAAHFGQTAQPQRGMAEPAFSGDKFSQWLAVPANRKKALVAAIGGFIALILFLAGGPVLKLVALVVPIAIWAIFFRHGYHETAGLRAQARIPADEAIRLAVDIANGVRGLASSIQVNGSSPGRADFTVRGLTCHPLDFHIALRSDPSGWTFLSTHLDSWTWRRVRVNFIPVPFTKRIDGYGLYKSFGDRLLKELQQRDPSASGAFSKRPT